MFLKIIGHVPYLQCLVSFSSDEHKSALKKFLVLWAITSLPIIVAALLSPAPVDNPGSAWLLSLSKSISVSEQFVYTASFLTPVLYIWYERYPGVGGGQITGHSIKGLFTGYGLVTFTALVLMFLTAAAFSALKTSEDSFKSTFLYMVLTEYSAGVYFFALYCWYLSLVDAVPTSGGAYVAETRKSEQNVAKGLAARVQSRGESNER